VPSALEGIRICDLTGQLAGAGATRVLAAFGAEVIRIEDPVRHGRWDITRGAAPFADDRRGINLGGAFNNHNVGKLGITLNLKSARGIELLRELIAVSDVITENFAAGVMDRLGLSYETLRSIRPDIIYVSNSGFGHTGPYRNFKSWGPIVQAVCGLTALSGLPGLPPAGWGYSYMDHMGAWFMTMAVLSALIHRDQTGAGQHIDMACVEAGLYLCGPDVLDFTVNGRPSRRPGCPDSNRGRSPLMVPHNIYPACGEDNWIAIACQGDEAWAALAAHSGAAAAGDPRFRTVEDRAVHESELDALLAQWTSRHDCYELAAQLRELGVAAAAVARPGERIDSDPTTAEWGLWPEVEHTEIGRVRVDGLPVHLSETDWELRRAAPCLGEHTDEVLARLTGLDSDELTRLRAEGVA
jgi:crotonobetainyl-CoA:carnitine CoA-transferase CaiB-like acyl-CoA transferase